MRIGLACVALLLVAIAARATCPVTLNVSGPDANGKLSISATSQGECGGSTIFLAVDGNPLESKDCTTGPQSGPTCSITTTFAAGCLASGTHTVSAWGGCQHKGATTPAGFTSCDWDPAGGLATSTFTIDSTPQVAIAYDGPDPSGHGNVTIDWTFKNNGFGHVQYLLDGVLQYERLETANPSGTWTIRQNFTCAKPGPHVLSAVAITCGGGDPSMVTARDAAVDVGGQTTATGEYDEDAQTLRLTTHFPFTDSSLSRHLTVLVDGQERAGDFRACIASVDASCTVAMALSCGSTHHVEIFANGCSRTESMYNGSSAFDVTPACSHEPAGCRMTPSSSTDTGVFGEAADPETSCEMCPASPVHVGTGDVTVHLPLFTIGASPMPLPFGLHYHSMKPGFPRAISYPLGPGWTHPYNTSLVAVGPNRLQLYTATGDRMYFDRAAESLWLAARPAYIADRVTASDGVYVVHYPNGGSSTFDQATGHWLAIRDRWGNTISGSYDAAGQLVAITDIDGRRIALEYANGFLSRVVLPDGAAWAFDYASTPGGPVLGAIHDPSHPAQAWRTFAYAQQSDGVYRSLTEMRDAAGRLLEGHSYDFGPFNRGLTSVSEGGRDAYRFAYDVPSAGQTRVTRTIDNATAQVTDYTIALRKGAYVATKIDGVCPSCGTTTESKSMSYDPLGRATSVTDAGGHVTTFTYDAFGNVTLKVEAVGTPLQRITQYEYAQPGWPNFPTRVTRPARTTEYSWNADETVLTITDADTRRVLTFDARHRLISDDGPRTDVADVVTRSYFADGRLQRVVDGSGLTTSFDDYDMYGTPRTTTDPNGVVTSIETDARGRVVRKSVAGFTTTTVYDAQDHLVETLSPLGARVRYQYEPGTNRLTDIVRADVNGNERERKHLTLDIAGDKVAEEDQSCGVPAPACTAWMTARSIAYVYDSKHRLAEIDEPVPAGAKIVYGYDADGRLVSVRDENHSAPNTMYAYDALGRLAEVTQSGVVTRYAYDAQDDLASVTDPVGNVTTYAYDALGRLLSQSSPFTGTTAYAYDPAGNLVSVSDAAGGVTTRTYDASNRILSAVSSRPGTSSETVTWTYDRGRVSSITDPTGSTTFAYDTRGLLASERKTIESGVYETSYAYDADGNRQRITYPSGRAVDFSFDFAGRPASAVTGGVPIVSSVSYAPFGSATRVAFGNGTVKTTSLDARYRVLENKLTSSGVTIADFRYAADAVGNILQIHDAVQPAYNRDFTYDDWNRLASDRNRAYAYDAAGNRLPLPGVARDATGNEIGEGVAYSPRNMLAASDGIEYGYDGRGIRTIATLVARTTVSGAVVTSAGVPIANATVTVAGTTNFTTTDASGRFAINVRSGGATLVVAATGFVTRTIAGDPSTIVMEEPPGTIAGTVVDAVTGAAIAGATVSCGTASADSDANGAFSLSVAAGPRTIDVAKSGFVAASRDAVVTSGQTVDVGPIALVPYGTLTGVVRTATGEPLADATVTATAAVRALVAEPFETATDSEGRFTLSLPPATYTLTIAKSGFRTITMPASVSAGQTASLQPVELQPALAPTSIAYLGPSSATYGTSVTLSARLTSDVPVSARVLIFDLGGHTASAGTDATGVASVAMVINTVPGVVPLRIGFEGDAAFKASETTSSFEIQRVKTSIAYVGKPAFAIGRPEQLVALLEPPVANALVTFAAGVQSATAIADESGRAAAAITLASPGPLAIDVKFAGDAYNEPSSGSESVIAYEPQSFVIWGGNARPPRIGDRVNFWGRTWSAQVTAGDYGAASEFKGYAASVGDSGWTAKDGDGKPPDAIASYVGVIVATSIGKSRGTISGNVAARVVVRSESGYRPDPGVPAYGTIVEVVDDTVPLFARLRYTGPAAIAGGTAVSARLVDARERTPLRGRILSFTLGSSVVSATTDSTGTASAAFPLAGGEPAGPATLVVRFAGDVAQPPDEIAVPVTIVSATTLRATRRPPVSLGLSMSPATLPPRRYSLYTPELHLMAETEITSAAVPAVAYEYVWLGSEPVAQIETNTGAVHYYLTDHMGTPILTTDANGAVDWRAEYDSYGTVTGLRTPDRHQPLRFPGQEAEQFDTGANGATGRSYNVFRWYRPEEGRYTQVDPIANIYWSIALSSSFAKRIPNILLPAVVDFQREQPFAYAAGNPLIYIDARGLKKQTKGCDSVPDCIENRERKKCCACHDNCYATYDCVAKRDWPATAAHIASIFTSRFPPPTACVLCNMWVGACFDSTFVPPFKALEPCFWPEIPSEF